MSALDFLPPDLDFLPTGLDFLPSSLETLPRSLAERPRALCDKQRAPTAEPSFETHRFAPLRIRSFATSRRIPHQNLTASPIDGAVSPPSHITLRPRTIVPTGQPVTVMPS